MDERLSPTPDRCDVAIVGGGVVGAACALELASRGASVLVLERDRPGGGCSYGNAGWLTPSLAAPLPAPGVIGKAARWLLDPESPFYIQPRPDPALLAWLVRFLLAARRDRYERGVAALVELAQWSLNRWERLADGPGSPFGFERRGLVAVFEGAAGLAAGEAHARATEPLGIPFEVWTAEALREREPAVRGACAGAVYYPWDAHCEPHRATMALVEAAVAAGARFASGVEVTGARGSRDAVTALVTTRGPVVCRNVVLAAGAWTGSLGREFGLRLPLLGGKGYSIVAPPLDPHPVRSLLLAERKIAINPQGGALRISGTLELVDRDLTINRRRVEAIVRGARGMLPLPDPLEVRELWSGLRPCTPDGMPLIGRARGFANVWLATGHQMTGLKTAPATGLLLAELMTGAPTTFDPAPFRADRY